MTKTGMRLIRESFYSQRQSKDYVEMGWMFWRLTIADLTNEQRSEVRKMWDSLTKREKSLCEQV